MGASLQQRVDDGWTVVGLEILLIVEDSGMQRRGLSDEATTHVRVCSKLQQFANDNEVAASELSTSDRFNERGLACRVLTVDVCASCQLTRSEEHTSELQSPCNLVCRLLLEKK